jgi:hypothetical protein
MGDDKKAVAFRQARDRHGLKSFHRFHDEKVQPCGRGNYLSERRPGSQQTKKQLIKGLTGSGWTNYIVAQTHD